MVDFDALASSFDTERRKERATMIADMIASHVPSGKTALEYGCGTGLVGMALLDHVKSLVFMDPSSGMIAEVEKKITTLPFGKASAVCGILPGGIASDQQFDLIFSSMALHHIHDVAGLLQEFFLYLADKGQLCIIDLDANSGNFHGDEATFDGHDGFDHASLKALCENAGFHQVDIHTWYHGTRTVEMQPVPYSLFFLKATK